MDVGFSAQEIDDLLKMSIGSYSSIGAQGSSYTVSTAAGANGTFAYNYGNGSVTSNPIATYDNKLHVKGDTVIEGDLKVDGVSFKETIEAINKRLAILKPDPDKLKHFEALQKAYDHYKTLEALCEIPKKEDK
jgi:hypothetical protein